MESSRRSQARRAWHLQRGPGGRRCGCRRWRASISTSMLVPLTRLAVLVECAAKGELPERVLGEMRLLEDRFGLNPVSRRRLQ